MAKTKKPDCETPEWFSITGRVVYSDRGLVVVEDAAGGRSEAFASVWDDMEFYKVCNQGELVWLSYHHDKKGKCVVDSCEAVELPPRHEDPVADPWRRRIHDIARGTRLREAARLGDAEKLQSLIEAGAPLDMKSQDGRSALHYAAYDGHGDCVAALLAAGADVDAMTASGETPAMYASMSGQLECLRILVDCAADLSKVNRDGRTAGDWARQGGHALARCAELIGAVELARDEMNALDRCAFTPLEAKRRAARSL